MKKSVLFEGVAAILLVLLSFLVLAMVIGGPDRHAQAICEPGYTLAGSGDTLYAFSGDRIVAFGKDGMLLWTYEAPAQWHICDYGLYAGRDAYSKQYVHSTGRPIVAEDNGTLYVYLGPDDANASAPFMDGFLVAISGGKKLWGLPFRTHMADCYYANYSDAAVYAAGGRAYVFHDYNETVVDENGTVLWTAGNVSSPAAVDERGFVYVVRSPYPAEGSLQYPYDVYVPDHRDPTTIIDAYDPGGTLRWESYAKTPLVLQSLGGTLPLYDNGMVYAPTYDGITAFYANGTEKWTRTYAADDFAFDWPFDPDNLTAEQQNDLKAFEQMYPTWDTGNALQMRNGIKLTLGLYSSMPFDGKGDVFLQCQSSIPVMADKSGTCLLVIGPDGKEASRNYQQPYVYSAAKDGIGFTAGTSVADEPKPMMYGYRPDNLTDLLSGELQATDVTTGKALWNYTFAASDPTVVVLDSRTTPALLGPYMAEQAIYDAGLNASQRPISLYGDIQPHSVVFVYPGDGVVYAAFQSMNYENPIVLGKSKCAYAGGVYAFAMNGTLLWRKPMAPFDTVGVTRNGTVFYRTPDGKIGVTGAGIAAGITLTAVFYLVLRFLAVGAVARARARLDKNDNRNRILDFIARNPGSSRYDVARGTGINPGTARYHLFILRLNRKVVECKADGKYVRYFTNAGAYDRNEQLVLSLMRREAMGRILRLMAEKPGISNADIARELAIRESVVSRCVRELSEKGVVARDTGKGCFVGEEHRECVARASRRIYGE